MIGAGAISKYPKEHAKAHIDCSNGINDTTLLAACLNALGGSNINKVLKTLPSSIFCEKFNRNSEPPRMAAVKPTQSKYLCIGHKPSSATIELDTGGRDRFSNLDVVSTIVDTLHREISDCSKSPKIVKWEELPEWVAETTKCVFAEVFKALTDLQQKLDMDEKQLDAVENSSAPDRNCFENDEEANSYIFNVVATLICLDSMGVREVTCSPLPMIYSTSELSSNSDILTDLQRGMTVNPARTRYFDHATPPTSVLSTAIGITLLRVLTGANTSRRSRISPMTLQKYGFAIDDNDRSLKVSIAVGLTEEGDGDSKSGVTNPNIGRSNNSMRENSLFHSDHVAHLETNLDDISGESLAFAIELLLKHGAIDAWVTPIVMKKGRPAHTLHCLCKENNDSESDINTILDSLLKLMFEHTSTLGVRVYRRVPRAKLDRSMITVTTPFMNTSRKGRVDVKVSKFKNGQVVTKKAEFDHCKEIAIEEGIGIEVVAGEAIKKYDNEVINT